MAYPICGGKSFERAYIPVNGSYAVAVSGVTTYHDGYNMQYEDLVHVCTACGYVFLFADFETQQQILK